MRTIISQSEADVAWIRKDNILKLSKEMLWETLNKERQAKMLTIAEEKLKEMETNYINSKED